MAFNFEEVLKSANSALQNQSNSGGGYKYKLVYPGPGTLTVKLLFNPKSNIALRLVNRHTIGENKVPCLRTFGKECPICKSINNIQNAKNVNLSKMRSITRGIAFAQIVSSTYKLSNDVNPGDIVLLMFPWTVYKDLSQQFSQARTPQELGQFIASNEGYTFNITRGADNKYTTQLNPFNKFKTCETDEEFNALLNGLEPLNDQIVKDPLTEEVLQTVSQTAQELDQQYLVHREAQFQTNPGNQQAMNLGSFGAYQQPNQPNQDMNFNQGTNPTMNVFNPGVGVQTQSVDQGLPPINQPSTQQPLYTMNEVPVNPAPKANANGVPPCFGRHGLEDINKCLLCPKELDCQNNSSN